MRTQTEQKGEQQAMICNWEAMPTQETPGARERRVWDGHNTSFQKNISLPPPPTKKKKKTELWLFQSKLEVR